MSKSTQNRKNNPAVDDVPTVFDPEGDVLTTDHLEAYVDPDVGKPMLNNYIRYAKVGGGQHGTVYLCHRVAKVPRGHPEYRLEVAMKSVKRVNPREEKMKKMLQHHQQIPMSSHGVSVADKVYSTEAKIRKEIAIMKKLRHPHVVRLYEVIDDRMKEKIYMVMEYLGGGEVKWRDNESNPVLAVGQTRRIIRDALLGLEYLHYQGIIHRDIKPANLLWTADRGHVKIGDFGVSHFSYAQRLAAAGAEAANNGSTIQDPLDPLLLDDSSLTRRAGTPSFLAPEVIWEFRGVKGKSLFGNASETQSAPAAAASPRSYQPPSRSPPSPSTSALSPPSAGQSPASQLSPLADATTRSPVLPHSSSVASSTDRPPITKAIDVWALGVTLYCLLFGHTPFAADKIVPNATEWMLYECIANDEWEVPDTMGWDQLPTGGRPAAVEKKDKKSIRSKDREKLKISSKGSKDGSELDGEGPGIVRLLEKFLQKDPSQRITLDEVKLFPLYTDPLPSPPLHPSLPHMSSSPPKLSTSTSSPTITTLRSIPKSPSTARLFKSHPQPPTPQLTPKHSSFILTDLRDPDDWLRRTSPFPMPRITASSNEASEAMSAVRFRADWGTRLVRHFSFWLKRTRAPDAAVAGDSTAGGSTAVGSGIGARINGVGGRRITGAHGHSPSPSRRAPVGRTWTSVTTVVGAESRTLNGGSVRKDKGKSRATQEPPQQTQPRLYKPTSKGSKKALKQPQYQRSYSDAIVPNGPHPIQPSASPLEDKSMGWWRRNVAGILTWSPDKFDGAPEPRKEEKRRRRWERKGKMKDVSVGLGNSEFEDEGEEVEEDGEFWDPLASSRTFDEDQNYGSYPMRHYGDGQDYSGFGHDHGQHDPDNDISISINSVPAPPSMRRSEEALRMYRPSPSSSDSISRAGGGGLLTAARRASSWGQGDEGGFEIQSVRSMDVAHEQDFEEMNERVMWVGAGGVQNQGGVLVPVPVMVPNPNPAASGVSLGAMAAANHASGCVVRTCERPVGMTSGGTVVEGLAAAAPSTQAQNHAQAPNGMVDASETTPTVQATDRREGPRFDIGDTSTISSGRTYEEDEDDDQESGEWHRGSAFASMDEEGGSRSRRSRRSSTHEGGEIYDDGDELSSQGHGPHYDDDDDSSEHAVTFSPRRRAVQPRGEVEGDLQL